MRILLLLSLVLTAGSTTLRADQTLALQLRSRTETSPDSGRFHIVRTPAEWQGGRTAVIVCDMWDLHHCLNATRRVGEMAPRMDRVLSRFRQAGAVVIHAPSSCTDFYADHPARKRVQDVPRADTFPDDIGAWCHSIPAEEQGVYPIDQSDGGEDDDPEEHQKWAAELTQMGRNPRAPWIRQVDLLTIQDNDYISDNGEEVWSILQHHGIDNVVLVGVHTNMCVLGRPFGLRNMARAGKNVVLMRDMTDTMYNPAMPPFVSHFTGTDLIVEHIEKWVCPTITSDQILDEDRPFRFANDDRPHVVIAMAEREYETADSLPAWALASLGKDYRVTSIFGSDEERNTLPGIDVALNDADLLLVSVRRRALPDSQLQALRRFIESGKPVVGIRTANHAFSLRGAEPPEGTGIWEAFDQEVIGGNYTGHHGDGPDVSIRVAEGAADHPILQDVDLSSLAGHGSLYLVRPLQEKSQALLIGSVPNHEPEPIAWTHLNAYGGRVFYTSLGHVEDFEQPAMAQLLANAVAWALDR